MKEGIRITDNKLDKEIDDKDKNNRESFFLFFSFFFFPPSLSAHCKWLKSRDKNKGAYNCGLKY